MQENEEMGKTGIVYRIKKLKGFSFLHIIVDGKIIQAIFEGELPDAIKEQSAVAFTGIARKAQIKDKLIFPNDLELKITSLEALSTPSEIFPFDITKKELNINNSVLFDLRALSMRHPKIKAIFKIQEAIVIGFRSYLHRQGFSEIRTPKIVKAGAEGGANIFELNYFGSKAFLAQSPQFYKEFCCGVFQKVFEVGPVFRAEKHNTNRHINEYTSLDMEMGPIKSFFEIMKTEEEILKEIMATIEAQCSYELNLLEITLPQIKEIPVLKFSEAKEMVFKEYSIDERQEPDLSPLEESKICEFIKKKTGSDFVFVTHYPTVKRPFYAKESLHNREETESFDLLFRGIEITTGGQRIHEYHELIEKMQYRGMNVEEFTFFSNAHKYGLPPHGGFGMGLERLTQKIIGLDNIKEATMFPRDVTRLFP
ncbi:MAG: aspartate--tRNA(Asn) ligase [Bdellovibrio sp.]|nr:aspartate--tRNA(Asn) ligase [Bdellovibrio sp.]